MTIETQAEKPWALTGAEATELRKFVDRTSLADVLDALARVCYGKSSCLQHLRQDKRAAKRWKSAGDYLIKVSDAKHIQAVSYYEE